MERFTKTSENTFDKLPELKKPGSRDARSGTVVLPRTISQGISKIGSRENNYVGDDSDPSGDRQVSLSKEVSKGISYLDVVSRVRDLERKYIDLASSMDRRVQNFIEENPQKILRHIKNIEEKETTLWKESHQKQLVLQDGLDFIKGSLRDNSDGLNQTLLTLQRRLDDSEFKVNNMMRGIESLNKFKSNEGLLALTNKPFDQEQKMGAMETEMRLLKEALNQERQKRDTFFQEVMQQYQQINNYVHQNENEILGKMRRHKEDVFEENKRTKEQQKKLEDVKLEKLLSDSGYIRSLLRQVEGKIEEEVNKRLKHEFENKNWMEQKIALFKQEVKADEKEMLENEKKFLQNIQESMNSLNQIVTNTREQLEANIAATQTLFNDNVRSISKTVDLLKNNVYTKLNVFDTSVKDLDQRVTETQKSFHEHTISVNETLDREFSRIEKVTLKFEEIMNQGLKAQDEKLELFNENNKIWKKNFEDKNLRVLTEISNALKTLKGELNKEKISTVERFENVKEEIASNQAAAEKLFEQANERIKGVETQFEYKVEETYVKASEDLRHAVDKLTQDMEKNGKTLLEKTRKELANAILNSDQKQKSYTDQEILNAKEDLTKNYRNGIDVLRSEVSKDLQSVHVKILDLQNQRADDLKGLQSEMKYLHDRLNEIKNEGREGLKHLSEEFDSKIKLAYQNGRNFASDRVRELREEMQKTFASQNDFIKGQVADMKGDHDKLINETYEKIQREIGTESSKLAHEFESLLEEERKARAAKDTEVINQLVSTKNMLLETINTKIESTQALARALVNEEAAERARSIEHLTSTFKKRMDAVEKYFKELISTSIEETKLELKELIRNVDIKVEEHKVWTIQQLNAIIKDFEDYILQETVRQYRDELFYKVHENERTEQWKQITEAFQVVGDKFDDVEFQKREEMQLIDKKLMDLDERNHQDHEDIYNKMEELNEERKGDIQQVIQSLENQKDNLAHIEKNVEEIQENLYVIDDKITNGLDELSIKSQVKDYIEFLYSRVGDKEAKESDEEFKKEVRRKHKVYDDKFGEVEQIVEEIEKAQETFEQKTENNFKIAEKALLAHRDFINQIDSRLTMEEMVNQILNRNLEDRLAIELATMGTQVDLVNGDVEDRFNKKMQAYQRKLEEDFLQHHLLNLENKIAEVQRHVDTTGGNTKDFYQQKISEHEIKLHEHDDALKRFNNNLANGHDGAKAGGPPNDEIKRELDKFKDLIDKIQRELVEKDQANKAIEKQIQGMNSNIAGLEKSVKGEMDKTYNNQNENHKAVTSQLLKLFDQFQTLQQKIEKR